MASWVCRCRFCRGDTVDVAEAVAAILAGSSSAAASTTAVGISLPGLMDSDY